MDFGFMNDNRDLFKVIVVDENRVNLRQNGFDIQGNNYSIIIELNQEFQNLKEPINLELLQTLVLPNFFPKNEILSKGWLAGRYIFEKGWTDALKSLTLQDWNDQNFRSLADQIRTKSKKYNDKKYVNEQVPDIIKNELVYSYICHLWNSIVTQRLETVGPKPQVGDLFSRDLTAVEIVSSPKDVEMTSVLMPIPGIKTTLYPANQIVNIYKAFIPKFGTSWYFSRIQNFRIGLSYRPIVCHVIDFEYSWISKLTFSLKFKLPLMNSYENVLRGLNTCIQLASGTMVTLPQFVPTIKSEPTDLVSASPIHPVPILEAPIDSACNIQVTQLNKTSKTKVKETADSLAQKKTQIKKPKVSKTTENKAVKTQRLKKTDEVDKSEVTSSLKCHVKMTRIEIPVLKQILNQNETKYEPPRTRASKRISEGRKRAGLPDCSKSVEIITISDSSDSELEPIKKKRKTRPLPSSPKTIGQKVNCNAAIKVKLEKGRDNPSTTGAPTNETHTPVHVKMENPCPVRVKIEPRVDITSST